MDERAAKLLAAKIRTDVDWLTANCKKDAHSYYITESAVWQTFRTMCTVVDTLDPKNKTLRKLLDELREEEMMLRSWQGDVVNKKCDTDYRTYREAWKEAEK